MNTIVKKVFHIGAIIFAFSPLFIQADDTEIYLGSDSERDKNLPNVIFLMDTSGSMGWDAAGNKDNISYDDMRLTIVKKAAIEVIEKIADDPDKDFNIALMSFDRDGNAHGGNIDMVMTPLSDAKTTFVSKMNAYTDGGGTPITESLDEALRYLRGDEVKYGDDSISTSKSGSRYISPVDNQCQENHIVLFSDGEPTVDNTSNTDIATQFNALSHPRKTTLINDSGVNQCSLGSATTNSRNYYGTSYQSNGITYTYSYSRRRNGRTYYYYTYTAGPGNSGYCAEELALLAQVTDLVPDDQISGFQNVTFHTVGGFAGGAALNKLKNIARFGTPLEVVNGVEQEQVKLSDPTIPFDAASNPYVPKNYYSADDSDGLKAQLGEIFNFIVKDDATFTAPAVSVNAFNKLQHQEQLYFSVFSPNKNANWKGNLKRYRLGAGGVILDSANAPAVDPNTGFFTETSHSFWTLGSADGKAVDKGGIASRLSLPPENISDTNGRLVTTFLGDPSLITEGNRIHPENVDLKNHLNNALLLQGTTTTLAEREKMLSWASGIDVNNEDKGTGTGTTDFEDPRPFMEDPLHSQPVIIDYARDDITKTIDSTIFLTTNSGYLHAFSPDEHNPQELFSFIPKELLINIPSYYGGEPGKLYGLDGPLSYYHYDINGNGSLLNSAGTIESAEIEGKTVKEYIHIYTSMRRGGRNYYALDVSKREAPEYLWQINGGTAKFEKLGQTWSKMTPAVVKWQGKETRVLFFGGGYDADTEDCIEVSGSTLDCSVGPARRNENSMGNAIFMVDAATGEYLWSASNADSELNLTNMTSSITGDLVILDTDSDGLADLIYSADTGGRVWRIDIDNSPLTNMKATGGLIADMNNDGPNNIRFYNTIDLAYINTKESGIYPHFQLSIGSGYRAHPLDKRGTNRFYLLNDFKVTEKPTTSTLSSFYETVYEHDLEDIAVAPTTTIPDPKPKGKYIILSGAGEKVLARSTTALGNVFFTTYRPYDGTAVTS